MKKRLLFSIPLLALALVSCGNKESGTSSQTGTTMTEGSTNETTNTTDDIDLTNTVTFLNKATKMTEELDYLPSGDDLTKSKAETATLNSQMLNSDGTADDEFGNYYKDITKQDLTEGGTKRIGTDYDCLYGFATKQVNYLVSNILSCRDIVVEKVTQLDTWVKDDGTYLYLSYDINSDTVSFKRLCPYFPYQEGVLTYNDKNELCLDFTIYELYKSFTVNYIENEYLYCEVYTNGNKEAYYYDLTSDTVDFYVFRYISDREGCGNPLWSAHIVEKDGYYISSENAYGIMQITLFDIKTEYKIVRASSMSIEAGLYAFDMQKAVSYRDGSFKIKFDNMYLSDINGFVNNLYYGLNVGKEGDHANIDLYPMGIDYSNIAGVITAFNDGVGSSTYAMDMIQYLTDNYDYYINPIYKGIPMKEMTFDYFGNPINPTAEVMSSLVPNDYINVNEQKVDTTPYKMVEIAAEGTFSNYDIDKINISVSVTNEKNLSTLYSYQYVIALKNNDEIIYVKIKPVGHKGDTIVTTFTKEDINTATFDIIYSKLKEYITAKDIVAILFGGEGNIDVNQYKDYVYGDKEDFTKDDILAQSNLMYGYGLYIMLKQFGFDLYTASPEEIQRLDSTVASNDEYLEKMNGCGVEEIEEAVMRFLDTRTSEELNDIGKTMMYNKSQLEMANKLYDLISAKMEENDDIFDLVINKLNSMPKEARYSILEEHFEKYTPVLYLAVSANGEYLRSSEYIFLNDFVSYPEYIVPEETEPEEKETEETTQEETVLEDTASEE